VRIVVDTSVLIAATLKAARVREVYLSSRAAEWVIPQAAKAEVERHLPRLAALSMRRVDEAREAVELLMNRAVLIEVSKRDPELALARELIGGRDPSDIDFVAACLKSGALGIWALDKDFDGIESVPRFTTAGVARLLELAGGTTFD
jgi:predicted nucleic acid-binding protein